MSHFRKNHRRLNRALLLFAAISFVLTAPARPSLAEEIGWMKGTLTAAVYEKPGDARPMAGVNTGDKVTIIGGKEGWTQVRLDDGKVGWIKRGYLKPEPPAMIRLEKLQAEYANVKTGLETELANLRETLESLGSETKSLKASKLELSNVSGSQKSELERLRAQNIELQARIEGGDRSPMMVRGAAILAAGMFLQLILGSLVNWKASRRPTPRMRL
ncbi:MAG: TIGR04211 family SH3 domain-containing protein [Deltaproteobacteria bacterium]|nr:TIGR04211 family SH3 domain-containing protein [Deltaproteobacteria bacterium]